MANPNLQRLCKFWQEKLRLTDWKVTIEYARKEDMPEQQGHCDFAIQRRTAHIKVLDPRDYEEDKVLPQDIEDTVVHELLHLHLASWECDGSEELLQEQAIDSITGALIALKRRRK